MTKALGFNMDELKIRLDPSKLSNPDLDIRYDLPEYLIERYQGLLEDDGFDYEEPHQFLVMSLKVSSEIIGLQLESITADICNYNKFGETLEKAVSIRLIKGNQSFDVYPET